MQCLYRRYVMFEDELLKAHSTVYIGDRANKHINWRLEQIPI